MKIFIFQVAICLFFISEINGQKIEKFISRGKIRIDLKSNQQQDSILLQYLGCGGFFIQKGENSLLIDPFFSNVGGLMTLPFSKIYPDSNVITQFFEQHFLNNVDEKGTIKGVLVSHAHYDHLFDVPYIFKNHLNQDSTQIYCGLTSQEYLKLDDVQNSEDSKKIIPLNANAWKPFFKGTWLYSKNKRIKILPILTEHAPHFLGMKLIKDGCELKPKTRDYPDSPMEMVEGSNFAFLIDFMDETGAIEYRIMAHAGAGSTAPKGFPPPEEIKKRPIDILLICAANENQAPDYPEGLINYCQPKQVVLAHWENFFKPRYKMKERPKFVPNTNIYKLIKGIEENFPNTPYILPALDAEMIFLTKKN